MAQNDGLLRMSDKKEVVLGAANQDKFLVSSYTINFVEKESGSNIKNRFPGNISPEGYFYSPFYEVSLKELDDDVQFIYVKRINFAPSKASAATATTTFYDPETKEETDKEVSIITIESPVSYNIIPGQPFCIYDISADTTHRGYLYGLSGRTFQIMVETEINETGLRGEEPGCDGKSQYIISILQENAPEYAEFIPSSQKLVWRGPKKMSELSSDSPLYDMPFTNGRLYIHKNVNVHVRRQDPENDFKLFRPCFDNPLNRYQVEGDGKLDFDNIRFITDSLTDAC